MQLTQPTSLRLHDVPQLLWVSPSSNCLSCLPPSLALPQNQSTPTTPMLTLDVLLFRSPKSDPNFFWLLRLGDFDCVLFDPSPGASKLAVILTTPRRNYHNARAIFSLIFLPDLYGGTHTPSIIIGWAKRRDSASFPPPVLIQGCRRSVHAYTRYNMARRNRQRNSSCFLGSLFWRRNKGTSEKGFLFLKLYFFLFGIHIFLFGIFVVWKFAVRKVLTAAPLTRAN